MENVNELVVFRTTHDMSRKELADFLGLFRQEALIKEWESGSPIPQEISVAIKNYPKVAPLRNRPI